MVRLQTLGLSKGYGGRPALRPLDLSLYEGEAFCLLGQNGAGKTTTLNLFLGFVAPTAGQALLNGVAVRLNAPDTHRFVAYISEVVMLYGELTGLENLRYFNHLAGLRYDLAALAAFLGRVGVGRFLLFSYPPVPALLGTTGCSAKPLLWLVGLGLFGYRRLGRAG